MDLKQIAKDTAKVLTSYLTYQALRTVMAQLSETNPPLALWLSRFSAPEKIQDGEVYLQELLQEQPDLAFRLMIVREHLAQEVAEFLPEMVRANISQANISHRKDHLERMTQLNWAESTDHPEREISIEPNLDN